MADQVTRSEAPDLVLVEHPARRRGPDGAPMEPPELLGGVALVTLNRPRALNALSFDLLLRLAEAVEALDADPSCGAVVITGAGTRAFAAGADVAELAAQTAASLSSSPGFRGWDRVAAVATPTIAAVRGFALGGGAELAMACDMLVAADDATFGQPEINLGVIPGAGGTQRLARAVGKARAMEIVLTGRRVSAAEAERLGFVTRVVPAAETLGGRPRPRGGRGRPAGRGRARRRRRRACRVRGAARGRDPCRARPLRVALRDARPGGGDAGVRRAPRAALACAWDYRNAPG